MFESVLIIFEKFSQAWLWRMTKKGVVQVMVRLLPAKQLIEVASQPGVAVKTDI